MENALKCNEWWWIWVYKTFKVQIQKGGPNNWDFLQNCFPPEIRSPLLNLKKFQYSEKNTTKSYKMCRNLMNDEKFRCIKLLKLKYRMGDQIIETFYKIGSPSLICRNFKTLRKVLLNQASIWDQALRSNEWRWLWVHKTFKIELKKGRPSNLDYLENSLPPEIRSHVFNL